MFALGSRLHMLNRPPISEEGAPADTHPPPQVKAEILQELLNLWKDVGMTTQPPLPKGLPIFLRVEISTGVVGLISSTRHHKTSRKVLEVKGDRDTPSSRREQT